MKQGEGTARVETQQLTVCLSTGTLFRKNIPYEGWRGGYLILALFPPKATNQDKR